MPAKAFADVLVAANDIPVGAKIWIIVVFVAFLAAVVPPGSVLGARLRALGAHPSRVK